MPSPLQQSVAIHERIKEQILALYGEEIDHETLMDTIEGEVDTVEQIAAVIRQARHDEALAEGLKALIQQMQDRKKRLDHRAERLRTIALQAMEETGRSKIEAPDFTASLGKGSRGVVITDESSLPEDCIAWKSSPDKKAIKERLEAGETVPGAELSNGGARLTVRGA